MERLGWLPWLHQGFVWNNPGYASLDQFWERFRAGQRRNVRRDQAAVAREGIEVRVVEGRDAPESLFELMHSYYVRTNDKFGPWGCRYLTRSFFLDAARVLRHRLAFSLAQAPGESEPVGMALLARSGGRLWGRYWGAGRNVPGLHFSVCYYAPMAYAVAEGLASFDPGMGGMHKVRRGFVSTPTASLHRFHQKALDAVFRTHLDNINQAELEHIREMNELLPFSSAE
jgi:predicted N-acyltransferase